jgi:hypothetical protein
MSTIRWIDPRDGVEVELAKHASGSLKGCTGCRYEDIECPHHGHGGPSCGWAAVWRPVAAPAPAAGAAGAAGAQEPDGYRVNADRTAAVSTDTTWRSDMDRCPRGVRVLLLVRDGCAVIGEYRGEVGFEAWHPLPRRGAGEGAAR